MMFGNTDSPTMGGGFVQMGEVASVGEGAVVCTLFELASALADLGLSNPEATAVTVDLLDSGRVRLAVPRTDGLWKS